MTVPADQHRATIQGLPLDPVEAQPRQVFFFDTPDLALNRAGLVVRARRTQGGRGDTVVKLRPVEPDRPARVDCGATPTSTSRSTCCPGGFVCSASFKGRSPGDEVRDAVAARRRSAGCSRRRSGSSTWTTRRRASTLDDLAPLGPDLPAQVAVRRPARRDEALASSRSSRRCGSTRTARGSSSCRRSACPSEAFQVAAETRAYLAERGHRPRRRAADEDEDRARVLRRRQRTVRRPDGSR